MTKTYYPIKEFIELFKKKKFMIIFIIFISIGGVYYYNNLKDLKYDHNLEFVTLNQWKANEVGINFTHIDGLIKNEIYSFFKEKFPEKLLITFDNGIYYVSFIDNKKMSIEELLKQITNKTRKNINFTLENKRENLQIRKDRNINNYLETKKVTLMALKLKLNGLIEQKEIMNKRFNNLISRDTIDITSLDARQYEVIRDYEKIEGKITSLNTKIQLELNSSYESDSSLHYELITLNNGLIEVGRNIKTFNDPNFQVIQLIKNFNIDNNRLSNLEIIIAGLLFGILINVFFLFLTSKYLRAIRN